MFSGFQARFRPARPVPTARYGRGYGAVTGLLEFPGPGTARQGTIGRSYGSTRAADASTSVQGIEVYRGPGIVGAA